MISPARTLVVCLSFAVTSFLHAAGCTQPTLTSVTQFAVGKNTIGSEGARRTSPT